MEPGSVLTTIVDQQARPEGGRSDHPPRFTRLEARQGMAPGAPQDVHVICPRLVEHGEPAGRHSTQRRLRRSRMQRMHLASGDSASLASGGVGVGPVDTRRSDENVSG